MPSLDPNAAPRPKPTVGQVLLGLFVLWQLAFLAVANVVEFVPHRPPGRDELIDFPEPLAGSERPPGVAHALATVTDRWAELTGQYQVWWLFAPGFPPQAAFPAVELRWAGRTEPVRLLSPSEPADPHAYFRPPGSADRAFHYEVRLGLVLLHWDEATAGDDADFWRAFHRERVSRQWKSIRAYLRLRLREWQASHPDAPPPDEAVLLLRLYRTPAPDAHPWSPAGPVERPLARWRPAEDGPPDELLVEVYEPFARRFERLPRPEEP
jgi:hypothetical protein